MPVSESGPRVLIVVRVYPDGGGIAAIVESLSAQLQRHMEVHVAVIELRGGGVQQLELPAEHLHVMGHTSLANPLLMPGSLLFALRTTRWLRRLVRELKPDAILAQDALNLSLPAVLAARGTDAKVAVMDHGTLSNVLDPRWQRMITRRLGGWRGAVFALTFALDTPWRALRWRAGIKRADAAWYVGYELAERFALAGTRARRYAQPVSSEFRPPTAEERRAARSQLRLHDDTIVVNMVTRLDREKGLDAVIDALARTLGRAPAVRVLIAGDGTSKPWMEDEIARLRLADRVTLLGTLDRDQVMQLHHGSDFHLYAGYIGCGMSVALLEAMRCGVIPIVSDVPAEHRELVDGAGWVFPAGDWTALRTALTAALDTPREELAELRAAVAVQVTSYGSSSPTSLVQNLIDWPERARVRSNRAGAA